MSDAASRFRSERSCRLFVAALLCVSAAALAGCQPQFVECEEPCTDTKQDVVVASLSRAWSRPGMDGFDVVIATDPYRVSDAAINELRTVMSEQAGVEVQVFEGRETFLPATGVLDWQFVVEQGAAQMPEGDGAAIVIVVVANTDAPSATFGFVQFEPEGRPTAVMVLHRDAIERWAIWPLTPEQIETATVIHEVGHWLGVPARRSHISAADELHCTNARCVMFKGSRITSCAVFSNLLSGLPTRFGPQCAAELAELRRRRETAR